MRSSLLFPPVALTLLLTGCAAQQTSLPAPTAGSTVVDPPARVARLSFVEGTVSFKAAGTEQWVLAVVNRPLSVGDELWTAAGSRAELELGHADVRLDAQGARHQLLARMVEDVSVCRSVELLSALAPAVV